MRRLAPLLVLGLVAAAYSGVPQAGFAWDDAFLVEFNEVLRAPTFENVWRKDLWCCTIADPSGYYRPLLTLSLVLDHWLYDYAPAGYHVTSLLLHLLVVGLVIAVLRPRVGPARASVAALIFGLHPVQSEAVVWVAARNDLLSAAGVLATLLALDRRRPVLAAAFALAGCLSKENAFLMPAVVVAWRLAWGERPRLADGLGVGAGLLIGGLLRWQADLHGVATVHHDEAFSAGTALHALVTLLGWVTWPWPLTTTASLYMAPPGPGGWLAAGGTLALAAAALWFGRARAFWLLAIAVGLAAPSLFGVRWYGMIGERYLYLPLFGVAAAVVASLPAPRWAPAAVAAAALAALAALHVRVPDWASEETLFTAAVERAPDGTSWNLLGVVFANQGRTSEAIGSFDHAIASTPPQRRACRHVIVAASALLSDDDLVRHAARWSERACKGHNGYDGAHAMALARRGRWDEAARVARDAVRNDEPARRDEVVRAAVEARDGDLLAVGARALRWPLGAADLHGQVLELVGAPPYRPAGAGAPGPSAPVAPTVPAQ